MQKQFAAYFGNWGGMQGGENGRDAAYWAAVSVLKVCKLQKQVLALGCRR